MLLTRAIASVATVPHPRLFDWHLILLFFTADIMNYKYLMRFDTRDQISWMYRQVALVGEVDTFRTILTSVLFFITPIKTILVFFFLCCVFELFFFSNATCAYGGGNVHNELNPTAPDSLSLSFLVHVHILRVEVCDEWQEARNEEKGKKNTLKDTWTTRVFKASFFHTATTNAQSLAWGFSCTCSAVTCGPFIDIHLLSCMIFPSDCA